MHVCRRLKYGFCPEINYNLTLTISIFYHQYNNYQTLSITLYLYANNNTKISIKHNYISVSTTIVILRVLNLRSFSGNFELVNYLFVTGKISDQSRFFWFLGVVGSRDPVPSHVTFLTELSIPGWVRLETLTRNFLSLGLQSYFYNLVLWVFLTLQSALTAWTLCGPFWCTKWKFKKPKKYVKVFVKLGFKNWYQFRKLATGLQVGIILLCLNKDNTLQQPPKTGKVHKIHKNQCFCCLKTPGQN